MTKSEIIAKTLRESPNAADDAGVVTVLNERVPEGDSKTCEDFRHLGVECCDTCHRFLPETEMYVEKLPEGGTAWICCAVRSALFPETKDKPSAGMDKSSTGQD